MADLVPLDPFSLIKPRSPAGRAAGQPSVGSPLAPYLRHGLTSDRVIPAAAGSRSGSRRMPTIAMDAPGLPGVPELLDVGTWGRFGSPPLAAGVGAGTPPMHVGLGVPLPIERPGLTAGTRTVWHRTSQPGKLDMLDHPDLLPGQLAANLLRAFDEGHDAILIKNYTAFGRMPPQHALVVKDRAQFRDPKARFDPAKIGDRSLMAGLIPPIAFGVLAPFMPPLEDHP